MTAIRSRMLNVLLATVIALVAVPVGVASAAVATATRAGSGCHRAATAGTTTQTLAVDGTERQYLLSIPPAYDPAQRAPLILNFHGLGSNKEQQSIYTGMNQRAGADGYV